MSNERSIASRYAAALFELFQEGVDLASDLNKVAQVSLNNDAKALLANSQVSTDDRASIILKAGRVKSEELKQLVMILCARSKTVLLPLISEKLEQLIRESNAQVMIDVTVAKDIDTALAARLKKAVGDGLGKKVELNIVTDASIIGGLILNVGDRQIDYSVRGRIDSLKRTLSV